jgi:hypothetical protein
MAGLLMRLDVWVCLLRRYTVVGALQSELSGAAEQRGSYLLVQVR